MARTRTPLRWLDSDGSPGELLAESLTAATAAPSVHNTQPWRFQVRRDYLDISIDPDRQLAVIDLSGREQLISVGAAIFNVRAAMLAHGWLTAHALWPAAGEDGPAARLAPTMPVPAPSSARALGWAIPRRHSNRGPFLDDPLPQTVLDNLVKAARAEGAALRFADPETRSGVLSLVHTAERQWVEDVAYRHELRRWTALEPARHEGIPAAAFGPRSAGNAVPLRDLGLAARAGEREVARFESTPTIAVLYGGEGPHEWLRTGQALQRVLLTATMWGVAATLMTQPLEIPRLRDLLYDRATGRAAQAIIRFGYPLQPSPASPRRPWSEVLQVDL